MLWQILQVAIFIGVGGFLKSVDIGHDGETAHASGMAVSLLAMIAAFIVTWIISKVFDLSLYLYRLAPQIKPFILQLGDKRFECHATPAQALSRRRDPPPLKLPH